VAILGSPLLMSTYKSAHVIFGVVGTPVAVFTDQEAARRWFFAVH
jgi:hypothetical protein